MASLSTRHNRATDKATAALSAFVDAADQLDEAAVEFDKLHAEHTDYAQDHAARAGAAYGQAARARAKADKIRELLA